MYSLTVKMNGETITTRTTDLNAAIQALKPSWLHTEVFLTVKKGKAISERHLPLIKAKRVFQDDFEREVFINNLLIT